jgi:hypothetical protein
MHDGQYQGMRDYCCEQAQRKVTCRVVRKIEVPHSAVVLAELQHRKGGRNAAKVSVGEAWVMIGHVYGENETESPEGRSLLSKLLK